MNDIEKESHRINPGNKYAKYLKSFVFGVEDSLVSTVGLLSGVAVSGRDKETIILAGVVLIFVEAFSMGIGSLLSENAEEEFKSGVDLPIKRSSLAALIMFVSYFIAGFIPLLPYLFFEIQLAFWVSVFFALISLFILGAISAKISGTSIVRNGLEMFFIGGAAILLGVIVGTLVTSL